MLQNFLYIVMAVLMIVGLVCTARTISFKLLSPQKDYKSFTVIPLEGHIEEAEYILRYERRFQSRLEKNSTSLVVANCGMDDETYTVCTLLLKDNVIDGIYSPEALSELYNGLS